ncbi:MAG: undecaprenyl/decaprenyl-phosphate alpha-N-acetylglucosaminyl 1-phosphate transferase [Candidatus Krumholzibacteria bacterium]|nr:undecaprenyl/decaprenyl-phosphate alpha-N-acetylglucosaminyl 1-phosphate transferase [Candidatus Krumholzibacteria bacterium]
MGLLHIVVSFLVACAFVATITPVVRKYALRWRLGAKPNGRKVSTSSIPHVGGIGMFLGTVLSVMVVGLVFGEAANGAVSFLAKLAIPVSLIVALGLTDDTKNLKAGQKLTIQILSSVVLALVGFHLLTGIGLFDQSWLFVILLTTFYLVGISSSVNLVDGLDGLAAGLSLISAATFAVLGVMFASTPVIAVSVAVSGACLGFLVYNFPPAKIYMGDTGSMFLGIMLGVIACSFTMLQPAINTFFGVFFILAIPIVDSWLAIVRRLILRTPVFRADSLHVHHVLSLFGFSPRQVLGILYCMQALMALLGILTVKGLIVPLILGLVIVTIMFLSFIKIMVASKERTGSVAAKFTHNSIPSLEK